jgi:hypothetical protein
MTIDDFKTGMIVKMEPGAHTTKPYYVLIAAVTHDGILTTIPGKRSLFIQIGSYEWSYHTKRMTIVSMDSSRKDLLLNQAFD